MVEKNETFNYIYSAKQQEEIKNIRKKYLTPEEDKMEQLRKLHHSATQKAQARAIALGVIGALIMGTGMSLAMTNIGTILGLGDLASMAVGFVVGIAGMALVGAAYPIYCRVLKKERAKIAPEILRLTDELLQ